MQNFANAPLVIVNTSHNPQSTFSLVVTWDHIRYIIISVSILIWKVIHATKLNEIVIESAAFEQRNQFHRGMITLKCVCAFVRKFVFYFKVCSFVASKKTEPTTKWFVSFFVAIRTEGTKTIVYNKNRKPQNPVLNPVQESDSIDDSNLIF